MRRRVIGLVVLLVPLSCASGPLLAQTPAGWDRTPECEEEFLQFHHHPSGRFHSSGAGFGSYALAKDGSCFWVVNRRSQQESDLEALRGCQQKSGFVCRVTHHK